MFNNWGGKTMKICLNLRLSLTNQFTIMKRQFKSVAVALMLCATAFTFSSCDKSPAAYGEEAAEYMHAKNNAESRAEKKHLDQQWRDVMAEVQEKYANDEKAKDEFKEAYDKKMEELRKRY